ncbi:MAG: FAD-dependent monooxygenase [Candidatus Syntropharchaeia archaeon]
MKYDVVIVGAGPAGSVAGKMCAESGLKTLILEMGRKPGEKNVSGTTIPLFQVYETFPWMKEMPITRTAYTMVHYWVLPDDSTWFKTEASPPSHPPRAVNVYRDEWDVWMAEQAVASGSELRCSSLVTDVIKEGEKIGGVVTDKGEKIESEVLIIADGVNSMTSRKAGLRGRWKPNQYGVCVKYDWKTTPEQIEIAFNAREDGEIANEIWFGGSWSSGMHGYAWLIPNHDSISIGWYGLLSDLKENPTALLWNFMKHPLVKTKLKGGEPRYFMARNIPISEGGMEKTYGDGVMVVGDAAGFACILEGCGLPAALWSGKFAAETAIDALSSGDTSAEKLKEYEDKWKNSFIFHDITGTALVARWVYKVMGAEGMGDILRTMIEGWLLKHGWCEKGHDEGMKIMMEDFMKIFPRFARVFGGLYGGL